MVRHRIHQRDILFTTIERSFLSAGTLLIALVTLLVIFLGVYLRLA